MIEFARIIKTMYWSFRKDRRVLPHLLTVIWRWLAHLVSLRIRRLAGRNVVAIALIEHLGDVVAAEPISRFARRQYPGSRIAWVTGNAYASLPALFPAVDEVITVTCMTEWQLLRASGIGHPALDLHMHERHCLRCQVPVLKHGPAAGITSENYYRHGNLLAVRCLSTGLPVLTDGPQLQSDIPTGAWLEQLDLPSDFIVIHCSSNEPSRDWPQANWTALLQDLSGDAALTVIEVGTRATVVTGDSIGRRNLCGRLTLPQVTELIRRAALFIGVDSGPAHIANAVGVPGVILMGHFAGFEGHMPFSGGYQNGTNAEIVRADGPMTSLAVGQVLAAVRKRLRQPHGGYESADARAPSEATHAIGS